MQAGSVMSLMHKIKIVMAVIAVLLIPEPVAGQPKFRIEVAPLPRLIPGIHLVRRPNLARGDTRDSKCLEYVHRFPRRQ